MTYYVPLIAGLAGPMFTQIHVSVVSRIDVGGAKFTVDVVPATFDYAVRPDRGRLILPSGKIG